MKVTKETGITKIVVELTEEEANGIAGVLGNLPFGLTPTYNLYSKLSRTGVIGSSSDVYKEWRAESKKCIIY